ncbi:MAG: TonB-dependent receptor [Nitrospirae bacterium]|nr:TonB-dependent receptor [Nitrospirota bacterium]
MGEVVVTATRYEEQLSSVPANISVISEDEIKGSTARNIPDLLRTQVGIQVNDIGGNRRNMTVDIRGFGETSLLNTLVLVDGRRVNIPDLSGTDWTLIPLDRVKKIEIIRGGRGSVLYGVNATGGVINIITKEGGALKAGAEAAYGSYGTFKGSAYLSGSSNNISYSLNGSYLSSDGYRQNSDTEAKDLGTNINYYISDFLKLNLSAGYHKDDTRLPGALKESDFDAGHSRTDSITPDNYAKVEDYYFKAGPEFYFWKDSLAKIDASYRKRSFMSFASFAEGHFLADTDIVTLALSPQILLKHDIGKVKNTLSLGLDYTKAEENILNESLFFGMQSTGDLKFEKDSTGYYFHDEVGVTDDLLLSAGYRHDSAGFDFNPGTPDHTSMNEDLYTAGINYNYYKKCYTYFSLSRSFRYPIFDELFSYFTNTIDVSLDPQRSDDYELGIRHYFADNAYVHFNLFRIDTESEIFFNPLTFLNENLDAKSRRDGVEISVSGKPYDWLELNGSYTYMDAKIKGGSFAGKALPDVAHNKATAGVAVFPVKGLTVSLKGIFVGKRPFISDFANDFNKQSGYLIVNSKIKYEWKGLTAFLDINNLTDKEYSEYGVLGGFPVEKAFYPSPKRNFMAGLSFAF